MKFPIVKLNPALALTVLGLWFLLSACAATPPKSQLQETDLVWAEKTISKAYQLVYKDFQTGFTMCQSDSVFIADPMGTPECAMNFDGKVVQCTVYHAQVFGPRGDRILGVFSIKAVDDRTSLVRGGYDPRYGTKESLAYWMRFAEGDYRCSGSK